MYLGPGNIAFGKFSENRMVASAFLEGVNVITRWTQDFMCSIRVILSTGQYINSGDYCHDQTDYSSPFSFSQLLCQWCSYGRSGFLCCTVLVIEFLELFLHKHGMGSIIHGAAMSSSTR